MLPRLVEYLLSLRRPSGDALVYPGTMQTIVPAMPPNTPLYFSFAPPITEYCHIWFRTFFGREVVPYAFDGWAMGYEGYIYSGTIDSGLIEDGVNYFLPLFTSRPLQAYLINTSPLNQFYSCSGYYILVKTERDYGQMMAALAGEIGLTAPGTQILTEQAKRYLEILERGKI